MSAILTEVYTAQLWNETFCVVRRRGHVVHVIPALYERSLHGPLHDGDFPEVACLRAQGKRQTRAGIRRLFFFHLASCILHPELLLHRDRTPGDFPMNAATATYYTLGWCIRTDPISWCSLTQNVPLKYSLARRGCLSAWICLVLTISQSLLEATVYSSRGDFLPLRKNYHSY